MKISITGGLTTADGSYASTHLDSGSVRNGQSGYIQQDSGSVRNVQTVRKGQCGYTDILEAIEKAGQLREQGVLTDEEFWKVKHKLLAKF